jgi:hypothetical protein
MVVHHVKVDDIGAGGDDVADLFTQAGEIGGQNAGSDAESGHGFGLAIKKDALFYAAWCASVRFQPRPPCMWGGFAVQ